MVILIVYSLDIKFRWDKHKNEWSETDSAAPSSLSTKQKSEEDDEEVDTDDEDKKAEKKIVRQDMSKGTYGTDGSTLTYTDPADGTVYLWDKEKSAWFPKVSIIMVNN